MSKQERFDNEKKRMKMLAFITRGRLIERVKLLESVPNLDKLVEEYVSEWLPIDGKEEIEKSVNWKLKYMGLLDENCN